MKLQESTAVFALALVACIPAAIWSGLVFSILWGWFVVPLGVQNIGIAHAIGLACLAGMLIPKKSLPATLDRQWLATAFSHSFSAPTAALLTGLLASFFM